MSKVSKVSFRALMDEDLARKLQAEEDNLHYKQQLDMEAFLKREKEMQQGEDYYYDEENYDQFEEEFDEDSVDKEVIAQIDGILNQKVESTEKVEDKKEQERTEEEKMIIAMLSDEEYARKLAEEEDYLAALQFQEMEKKEEERRMSHNRGNVGVWSGLGSQQVPYLPQDADDEMEHINEVPHPIKSSKTKKKNSKTTKHDAAASEAYNSQNISKFMNFSNEKNPRLPSVVYNSLKEHSKKHENNRIRFKSREDHASYEQALDPRTRIILFKMLNAGVLENLSGVVSTGKEANVYHANGVNLRPQTEEEAVKIPAHELKHRNNMVGGDYAIKIFKTTLNEFKNREEYIAGEFRFRNDDFSVLNPRKFIKIWAQKEMRNLKRIHRVGDIPCPFPVILREHVLVMSFIGDSGIPAPSLKDAPLTHTQCQNAYKKIVKMVRSLYQKAKLVHADLSEYNILYFQGTPYFIDVSQAVEHDHPKSLDFLLRDCQNISTFFKSKGVEFCMSPKQLFDFVRDATLDESTLDAYIDNTENQNKFSNNNNNNDNNNNNNTTFTVAEVPRSPCAIEDPFSLDKNDVYSPITGLISAIPEILVEDTETTTDDEE